MVKIVVPLILGIDEYVELIQSPIYKYKNMLLFWDTLRKTWNAIKIEHQKPSRSSIFFWRENEQIKWWSKVLPTTALS